MVWPMLSLTTLRSSRSTTRTAMAVPARRGRASARETRSVNSDLFGSPVRASWKDRWVSSRCSERCSLTSRRVSTSPAIIRSPRRSR